MKNIWHLIYLAAIIAGSFLGHYLFKEDCHEEEFYRMGTYTGWIKAAEAFEIDFQTADSLYQEKISL